MKLGPDARIRRRDLKRSGTNAAAPADVLTEFAFHIIFGALIGGVYGFFLALIVALVSGYFASAIIVWSAGGFALIGFFNGGVIWEAFTGLAHFIWGLANGLAEKDFPESEPDTPKYLRLFAMIGFVTGIAILAGLHL